MSDDEPLPSVEEVRKKGAKKGIPSNTLTLPIREAEGLGPSKKKKKRRNRNVEVSQSTNPPESANETAAEDQPSSSNPKPVRQLFTSKITLAF